LLNSIKECESYDVFGVRDSVFGDR